MHQPLVNLPFVGNTALWALMANAKSVIFEACGPYQRRTARTRTAILTKEGALDINVPVHTNLANTNRDARINYDTPWNRQIIYALRTAYNSSAYYEFFEADFVKLFQKNHVFLWDLNIDLFQLVAQLAGLSIQWTETTQFLPPDTSCLDLRIGIETKHAGVINSLCKPVPYTQVFAEPYSNKPFTPYLSMLDLLFNEGPLARRVLRNMVTMV